MTTKNKFVVDGKERFEQGREAALRQDIREKYTDAFASASPLKKLQIKFQMQREFLRCRKEGTRLHRELCGSNAAPALPSIRFDAKKCRLRFRFNFHASHTSGNQAKLAGL